MHSRQKHREVHLVFDTLLEQYLTFGLPVDKIDPSSQFSIHNLKDIHADLPYQSPKFRPGFYSFVFVKNATGKYTTDEQVFKTVPGTVYFTNPGHYKSYRWHRIEEAYLITLTESFLKENVHARIFEEFPFLLSETVTPSVLKPQVFAEFENLYLQIRKEYFSNSPYKNRMIGNLFVVILLKIKEYFWRDYNPIYEGDRGSQIVKDFKLTLEHHYRDILNGTVEKVFRVQDYAAAQNLHPNYLNNVLKSKTGKSISTWITDKTISEAKSLLQNSSTSIKQIAYQLGFTESTHFSNYFKKQTEMSPVEFRKQTRHSNS
jgi:AraC family transcriptional activator of pobA